MQIANLRTGAATGDGLNNLAGRVLTKAGGLDGGNENAAQKAPGLYDPSSRVSLSVEATLYLSRSRRSSGEQPALTTEEWNNKVTPSLAVREFKAFGKYGQIGDNKDYYRAYIDYYDSLRPEDQVSHRYSGTRAVALAELKAIEYSEQTGETSTTDAATLMDQLLNSAKPGVAPAPKTRSSELGSTGWDIAFSAAEGEDDFQRGPGSIEKLYAEVF